MFLFVAKKSFKENSDHLRDNGVKLVENTRTRKATESERETRCLADGETIEMNCSGRGTHTKQSQRREFTKKKQEKNEGEEVHENAEWELELVVASLKFISGGIKYRSSAR